MNKGIQIVLLVLLFIACTAGGYFLGGVIMDAPQVEEVVVETVAAPVEIVEEVVVVPAVPVVESVSSPVRDNSGNYSLDVLATVHTGDPLEYFLYEDAECYVEKARSTTGKFASVAPAAASTYYLRVVNVNTGESTEAVPVKGFVKLMMYEKITKAELEKICKSGDYGTAPAKFNHRIASKLVIGTNGINDGERGVASVADVCQKVMMGTWSSVNVEGIEYDTQNRMKKLTLRVNY